MPRPVKWRKIAKLPQFDYFHPGKNPGNDVVENCLKIEEYEALRLKDFEGFDQDECARLMEVSRATFQRILLKARHKVADALINGKAIKIEGGNYTKNICTLVCRDCGKVWQEGIENLQLKNRDGYMCGDCGSQHIACYNNCLTKSNNCCLIKNHQKGRRQGQGF